jgi:hypothetical protein
MTQNKRKGPRYNRGSYVKIHFLQSDGRWKYAYLNKPEYAMYDGTRGQIIDFMYLEDNLCLYTLKVSGGVQLTGIPEDCLVSL